MLLVMAVIALSVSTALIWQEQYTRRWRNDARYEEKFACFAWFYVGQRAEIKGRIDDAVAAYGKAVELGQLPNAHHTANRAAYRLRVLRDDRAEDESDN